MKELMKTTAITTIALTAVVVAVRAIIDKKTVRKYKLLTSEKSYIITQTGNDRPTFVDREGNVRYLITLTEKTHPHLFK